MRAGLDRALIILVAAMIALAAWPIAMAGAQGAVPSGVVPPNAPPPGEHPKIEVLNPVYDFGTVLEGQPVTHTFQAKNAGQNDLTIDRVQTSCGCTAAAPSRKLLKPGETSDITVTFDTRHQKGHRVRTITAYSNDPQTPQSVMTLQGDVKVQVEATPEEVSFETVHYGTEATRAVTVTDLSNGKDFEVGSVTNTNPNIKVTRAALSNGKPGVELKVVLQNTMPIGSFDDTIEIVTNRQPLQVHVFGQVAGDLTVDPAQISFGIVPHGQGAVRYIRLSNSGNKALDVTGVSSSNQSVVAKVDPITPGKEYKITAQLRKGTPDGQLRGLLKITTNLSTQPAVTVPFYGIVGSFEG